MFHLILFLGIPLLTKGDATPTLIYESMAPAPGILNIVEGEPFNLTCTSNDPAATFFWNSSIPGYESRFGSSFYIPAIPRGLNGHFQCNTNINMSVVVEVRVLYPPVQPYITGPDYFIAGFTDSFDWFCYSEANPSSLFTWTYATEEPNPPIISHTSKFVGRHIESDAWIRCYVENNLVPTIGRPIHTKLYIDRFIDIMHPVKILQLPPSVSGDAGSVLEVVCEVVADPVADVWWTRAQDDWKYMGNILRIFTLTVDDAGVYICHANNTMEPRIGLPVPSYDEQSVVIHVRHQPGTGDPADFTSSPCVCDTSATIGSTTVSGGAVCPCSCNMSTSKGSITDSTQRNRVLDDAHIALIAVSVIGWAAFLSVTLWLCVRNKRSLTPEVTGEFGETGTTNTRFSSVVSHTQHRILPDVPAEDSHPAYLSLNGSVASSIPDLSSDERQSDYLSVRGTDHGSNGRVPVTSNTNDGYDYVTPTEQYM